MSGKNKNHNRIIFLTTLSVYLGLALVGATPQVLAQAAMTRQFDIKSEIEYKDDLDNKPDDENCDELKQKTVAADNLFLEQYARHVSTLISVNYNLETYLEVKGVSLGDRFPKLRKELSGGYADTKLDENNFFGSFHFKSRAENTDLLPIAAAYNASLNFQRRKFKTKPVRQIYRHTEIAVGNDQIFIVTRLPRAAIHALLSVKR